MSFYKTIEENGKQCVSANYLKKIGKKVNPIASLSPFNTVIFDEKGEMIDLLIPIEQLDVNLIDNSLTPSDIEDIKRNL